MNTRMSSDLITCPYCDGWSPSETGWTCEICGGDGVIWNDEPDDIDEGSFLPPFDPCPKSPMGQHQYTIADRHERCVFCGERSGLDR